VHSLSDALAAWNEVSHVSFRNRRLRAGQDAGGCAAEALRRQLPDRFPEHGFEFFEPKQLSMLTREKADKLLFRLLGAAVWTEVIASARWSRPRFSTKSRRQLIGSWLIRRLRAYPNGKCGSRPHQGAGTSRPHARHPLRPVNMLTREQATARSLIDALAAQRRRAAFKAKPPIPISRGRHGHCRDVFCFTHGAR
jgi:hypothetical protein